MRFLRWIKSMIELPGRVEELEDEAYCLDNRLNIIEKERKPQPCLLKRWARRNRRY